MAKILVADDNSNIQKMVGLALKDQGIDVVAVGNGEAAVRKISDVRPDLVLADVFMPVRNGYEVCQYVKTDSALSHIPVILLVGAFDPLDEQEAQRVGADGVLKKPFVPPDPLISMVKSALQRAGVLAGGPVGEKAHEPEPLRAADLLTPGSPKVPTVGAFPVPEESFATGDESFVEEVPARPEPIRIDSGAQHVAFGSLLETPAQETEEESFVSSPPPDFVADRDWHEKDEEEAEEEVEEEEKPATWRRDEAESSEEAAASKGKKSSSDWRTGGFEAIASEKLRGTGWEQEEEKPELVETVPAASNSVAAPPTPTPVVIPQPAPAPPSSLGADPWAAGTSSTTKNKTQTVVAVEETHPVPEVISSAKAPSVSGPEPVKSEPVKKETKEPWLSTPPPNPWDLEIRKAAQLASTWDAPVQANAPVAASNGTGASAPSEEGKAVAEEVELPPAAVEAIQEEAAQVAEDATQGNVEPTYGDTSFYAREEALETSAAPAAPAPSMDDVVAKVLSKMSPDMLQAVTREILRPVVEAMVKEELKSKK